MSQAFESDKVSIDPPLSNEISSESANYRFSEPTPNVHSDVVLSLTTMLQSLSVLNSRGASESGGYTLSASDLRDHIRVITRTLDYIGPAARQDDPVYRTIVPPETCDATSLTRAAATLDMTKIRMLISTSRLSAEDLNSYAQLLLAQQDEYRRAHRRSLPLDAAAVGIYTPTEDEAYKFVDDNPEIFANFASYIRVDDYFQLLKAFTHESATDGKTSSKLLSMIGKYALKLTTYRMCYMNGESYALAKERIYKYLDEDKFYKQALSMNLPKFIIIGTDYYNLDKEIVLQTLYAIFGLFYVVQGDSGLIHLNKLIKWFDVSA